MTKETRRMNSLLAQGYRDRFIPDTDTHKFANDPNSVACYWTGCTKGSIVKKSKIAGLFFYCAEHQNEGKLSWSERKRLEGGS